MRQGFDLPVKPLFLFHDVHTPLHAGLLLPALPSIRLRVRSCCCSRILRPLEGLGVGHPSVSSQDTHPGVGARTRTFTARSAGSWIGPVRVGCINTNGQAHQAQTWKRHKINAWIGSITSLSRSILR